MKGIIRKFALKLLQWSGMEIPEHLMDNVLTPFVIERSYEYSDGVPAAFQAELFEENQEFLWSYARKYVGSKVTKKDGFTRVDLSLVVQRPELPEE